MVITTTRCKWAKKGVSELLLLLPSKLKLLPVVVVGRHCNVNLMIMLLLVVVVVVAAIAVVVVVVAVIELISSSSS